MGAFYGFGMPLINIVILFCFVLGYIIDKIAVAFYHRKPPLYDDTLSKNTVYIMKWAAFIWGAIAYWMITNRQIFDNHVDTKNYAEEALDYDHHIDFSPPHMFQKIVFWATLACLALLLLIEIYYWIFIGFVKRSAVSELSEIEGLLPFPECLNKKDTDYWIEEEELCRNVFGYKKLFDETLNELYEHRENIKNDPDMYAEKEISDVCTFDLLA